MWKARRVCHSCGFWVTLFLLTKDAVTQRIPVNIPKLCIHFLVHITLIFLKNKNLFWEYWIDVIIFGYSWYVGYRSCGTSLHRFAEEWSSHSKRSWSSRRDERSRQAPKGLLVSCFDTVMQIVKTENLCSIPKFAWNHSSTLPKCNKGKVRLVRSWMAELMKE